METPKILLWPAFIEGKEPRSPAARKRATSAVTGLFFLVDETQDIVSERELDYARSGQLSSVFVFFCIGCFR